MEGEAGEEGAFWPREEKEDAVKALVNSVLDAVQQDHGLNIVDRTSTVYLDGGKALLKVFKDVFPDATHVRCLQHVKADIIKPNNKKKWKHVDLGWDIRDYAHRNSRV